MARISEGDRQRVRELFERHLEVGLHHGAQCAVYVDGELELDLAGGQANAGDESSESALPTTPDTRHVLFSCTKPYAAAALHALVCDGALAYDDRVVDHWPSFAEAGSTKASTTVRHVLSHTAGLPSGDIDRRPELWDDWAAVVERLEAMEPVSPPGKRPAYHSLTFGWLVGELVRRVSGSPIERVVADRVFDPLEMNDTGIGLRDDENGPVATLTGFDAFDGCRDLEEGLGGHAEIADSFNSEAIHRAVIPAANGIGTARDMARFYACLANGGELDGARILDSEVVETVTTLWAATDEDGTLGRPSRYGLGVWKGGTSTDPFGSLTPSRVFGHSGLGSSVGWADPAENISFAYVTNGVREETYEHVTRASALGDAVRLAVSG
ncbi:serine hydrolase domain-containing protein [Halostagnicola kamekurae]|uniref:CubicO group peptidase, beta-lactamase class C family n=1 Tax=Halostagnicola kamekurae TaxID=619731 RepID=A0A1I6PXT1_9EURY|nr:serine hydrolase domain-containing protein [Halostagnicola kamekurae]SFS44875.1 CubicO group peptidase, beta-lactamase class C family [Halostagnicola kamekurae]